MKFIITENKRIRLAINWLEDEYPDLKKYRHNSFSNEIFLESNGMFKMQYMPNSRILYVKKDIWNSLRSWFGFDDNEVGDLLLNWTNKKFGFRAKICFKVSQP